ncbi:hypothetical protein D3C71_1293440 [compost metagenome]
MQAGQGGTAPVAPVKRIGAAQAQRPGDGFVILQGQKQNQLARQLRRQMAQERQRQCRRITVLGEGLQVEAVHRTQFIGTGFVAMKDDETDARAADLGALLADVLAVLVIHR